jgi:hypothetical protein
MTDEKDRYTIQIYFPTKEIYHLVGGCPLSNDRGYMVSLYAEIANNYADPKRIIFKRFCAGKEEGREVELSDIEKELLTEETRHKLSN